MASYEKLLLLCVTLFLAAESIKSGYVVQGAIAVMLTLAVLKEDRGRVSLLLVPLALLGERCFQCVTALGHSPLPFYSAALFSYVASFPAPVRWKGWLACAVVSGALLFVLTGELRVGAGLASYVLCGGLVVRQAAAAFKLREALLLGSLAGLLVLDAVTNTNVSLDGLDGPAAPQSSQARTPSSLLQQLTATHLTSFPHIIGRAVLVGSLGVVMTLAIVVAERPTSTTSPQKVTLRGRPTWIKTIQFAAVLVVWMIAVYVWTRYTLDEDPLMWVWAYVHSRKLRLYALLLWASGIPLGVVCVQLFGGGLKKTTFRKMYHAIAVVAFLPVAVLDPSFLGCAIATATGLSIVVEAARVIGVKGTSWMTHYMERQIDERDDSSGVVRTHIYLILGFGLSIILRHRLELVLSRPTAIPLQWACDVVPGVIALGVVDALAAIGGTWTRGHHQHHSSNKKHQGKVAGAEGRLSDRLCGSWFPVSTNPSLTHKTWQGLASGAAGGLCVWTLVVVALIGLPVLVSKWMLLGVVLVAIAAVGEAVCSGVDNIELPLVLYACATGLGALAAR